MDRTIDLKHYGRLLWRRRGVILLCAVATLCATLIVLAFVPSQYESEVTLMIEDNRLVSDELQKLMGGIMRPPTAYGAEEERMAKLVSRIRSRPFLERVIRMLKMDEDPIIRARAADECRKRPGVTVDEMAIRILVENLQSRISFARSGPGVYRVIVAELSPENAQLLATWITELFVDVSSQDALERIRTAHEFGKEQLKIYEEQLQRSEDALERQKQSTITRTMQPRFVRYENLAIAEGLNRRVSDEASLARVRLKPYSAALAVHGFGSDQPALLADPEMGDMKASLTEALQNEMKDRLAGTPTEVGDWPPPGSYSTLRQGLLRQIETVTARHYPAAPPGALDALSRYAFAKIDLDAQLRASETLNNAIAACRQQAEATPGGEITLDRITEEVETNRRLLQSFQAQLVASDVSQAVEVTKMGLQIEIISPAPLPLKPSYPNRTKIMLAALLLGPLLGAGIAFVSEVTDPVLRSTSDFARVVPEPILGTTPLLTKLVTRHNWFRRHWVPVALSTVVLVTGGFFIARGSLLQKLVSTSVPVHLTNPKEGFDESTTKTQ
jgi:uncharacterized protein involved in exopolysaccharide biosynthesis